MHVQYTSRLESARSRTFRLNTLRCFYPGGPATIISNVILIKSQLRLSRNRCRPGCLTSGTEAHARSRPLRPLPAKGRVHDAGRSYRTSFPARPSHRDPKRCQAARIHGSGHLDLVLVWPSTVFVFRNCEWGRMPQAAA
jgi:hypothetical protein